MASSGLLLGVPFWRSLVGCRRCAAPLPIAQVIKCTPLPHRPLLLPQAAVLSAAQARNLLDPVLNADPLHAVTGASFNYHCVLLRGLRDAAWRACVQTQRPAPCRQLPLCDLAPSCAALPCAADSHFFWGAVLLGYLLYDTAYSLAFFSLRSGAVMLAHHLVGIAGCVIGAHS